MKRPVINVLITLLLGVSLFRFLTFTLHKSLSLSQYSALQNEDETWTTLQYIDDIDLTIEQRAQELVSHNSKNHQLDDRCKSIMIYMPASFDFHGHGSQLNTYLKAVELSTYLNRPLLLLEPPNDRISYDGGSQFGCPRDLFDDKNKADIPNGFSRLIDHPTWLHRGCHIPCAHNHKYNDWWHISGNASFPFGYHCDDKLSGQTIAVAVARGSTISQFHRQIYNKIISESTSTLYQWAINLGSSDEEAKAFVEIKSLPQKWDYVKGLMVRSGILKFQQWIARDVKSLMSEVDLPFEQGFDGIHVRRGDKVLSESLGYVINYWTSQGYTKSNMPFNYIPFAQYLNQWSISECPLTNGVKELIKHHVYVATDDPLEIKREIANLISASTSTDLNQLENHSTGTHATLLFNSCHQLTFYFNPTNITFFHIEGMAERKPIEGDDCSARYHRNIISILDLFLLARSKTFIGELSSNWGKLLRTMRLRLSDESHNRHTIVLDTRLAWGPHPR